jgi:hypothetical protein
MVARNNSHLKQKMRTHWAYLKEMAGEFPPAISVSNQGENLPHSSTGL